MCRNVRSCQESSNPDSRKLELYWLPQLYLKIAVVSCAATFIAQATFYTFAEYVAQKEAMTGELVAGPQSRMRMLSRLADFALTLMYLALTVTLVGIMLMNEPLSLYSILGKTQWRQAPFALSFLQLCILQFILPCI